MSGIMEDFAEAPLEVLNNQPQEDHDLMEIDDGLLDVPDSESEEELGGPPLPPPLIPQAAPQQPPLPPPLQPQPVPPPAPQDIDNLCNAVNNFGLNAVQPIERYAIVLADYSGGETLSVYDNVEIRWVTQIHSSIVEVTARVARFFDEQTPKILIINCYTQFLNVLPISVIMDHLRMVMHKAERNPVHSCCIATLPFKPALEVFWPSIFDLNTFIRDCNISLHQSPLSLHKATLTKVAKKKAMGVNGSMWLEKVNGTDLGSTLSPAGVRKQKQWISKHVVYGLRNPAGFLSAADQKGGSTTQATGHTRL